MSLRMFVRRAAMALALFVVGGGMATFLAWVVVLVLHPALHGGGWSIADVITLPCAGVLVGVLLAMSYLTLSDQGAETQPSAPVHVGDAEPGPGGATSSGAWRAREQEHTKGDRPTTGVPLFSCTAPQLFGSSGWNDEKIVHIFAYRVDAEEMNCYPMAVRIDAHTHQELAIALEAIGDSPASFVLYQGYRYTARGEVQVYDPARPASADELSLEFDVAVRGPDEQGRPCIHLRTFPEEWETARQAVIHLLEQGLLSPQSYIERHEAGETQVIAVTDLLHPHAAPESGGTVSVTYEHASHAQHGLERRDPEGDGA